MIRGPAAASVQLPTLAVPCCEAEFPVREDLGVGSNWTERCFCGTEFTLTYKDRGVWKISPHQPPTKL